MDHINHAIDDRIAAPLARAAATLLGVQEEPVLWALRNLGQGKYVQKANLSL